MITMRNLGTKYASVYTEQRQCVRKKEEENESMKTYKKIECDFSLYAYVSYGFHIYVNPIKLNCTLLLLLF